MKKKIIWLAILVITAITFSSCKHKVKQEPSVTMTKVNVAVCDPLVNHFGEDVSGRVKVYNNKKDESFYLLHESGKYSSARCIIKYDDLVSVSEKLQMIPNKDTLLKDSISTDYYINTKNGLEIHYYVTNLDGGEMIFVSQNNFLEILTDKNALVKNLEQAKNKIDSLTSKY